LWKKPDLVIKSQPWKWLVTKFSLNCV
jgi:hypothetical protein